MTLRFPSATINIQTRVTEAERLELQESIQAGDNPTVPGLRIKASTGTDPSGLEVNGVITSSTGRDGNASTLSLEVFNLSDDLARSTQVEGFVKVEAGYLAGDFDSFNIAPTADTPIFYGVLVDRFPIRNKDSNSWRFIASTVPSLLQANTVVDIGPVPQGERGPTIGEVISDVLSRAGAKLLPSAASIGLNQNIPNNRKVVEIKDLKASGPIMEVATELTKDIGDQISRALGKVSVHEHRLVPVQNAPMTFELIDTGDPTIATRAPGNAFTGRPVADVVLDEMTVHRAAPSFQQGEFEITYPPSLIPGKAGEEARKIAKEHQIQVAGRSSTYNFSGALDPRMRVGTPAKIVDSRSRDAGGFCVLTDVKHRFGRDWRTDWSGPYGVIPEDVTI